MAKKEQLTTAEVGGGGLTVRDLLYEPCKGAVSLAFNV